MVVFKTRKTSTTGWNVIIEHQQNDEADCRVTRGGLTYIPGREGDVSISVSEGPAGTLSVEMSEDRGTDRDNYPHSWDIEMHLNEDEVREIVLALTVYLERRAEASPAAS